MPELDGLLSWIACIGDAHPVESYVRILRRANFAIEQIEDHSHALTEMVHQIQGRLLGVEIAAGLKKLDFPNVDFSEAKRFLESARDAIKDRKLRYTAISAVKPH